MIRRLPNLLCFSLLLLFATAALHAAPRAIIVTGISANETQAARLAAIAATARQGLLARGFADASILTLAPVPGAPLRRDAVLAALAPAADASETWLVLLGTSAPARDGQPAFQLSGPRLTATDLASAVAALPGKKFVVVATSASGGFLPSLLALPDVEAVAATAENGEINEPRFAEFWAEALVGRPDAPFPALAAEAATRVAAFYTSQSLAQGENARLIDRAANRIIPALDASAESAPRSLLPAPSSLPPVDIAALSIPKTTADTEIELRPADPESLALLAAARAAAADTEHAALILRTEIEILVARDFSSRETTRFRAYVRTGEALDTLGSLHLPFDPPFTSSRLVTARVIRPDGSQRLLNPAARAARLAAETPSAPDSSFATSPSRIELPDLTADCVVEAEWTTDHRADATLPEFSREWHFARPYPQKSLHVTLTLPRETRWRAFAPHLPAPASDLPAPSSPPPAVSSHTHMWELTNLPARKPLPFDPPARTFTPWLGVSSVESWDSFAAWYRRIATGSDTIGPEVEALAATLAAAHPDRSSRIRAAYETVAALRYVAIELGVGAFRPRTPEQVWRQRFGDCKDKANLLVALLSRLGIEAEFALVNRFDTTFTDHPSWQFNHALARVPANPAAGQAYDLWLDATDRLVPSDVVAPGNLGRQALVFTRDFSTATFHEITAAQEPNAGWSETFSTPTPGRYRVEISATGSAEVALRRLLAGHSPAQLRALLSDWLEVRVTALAHRDPYDLAAPLVLTFETTPAPRHDIRPLAPGLASYLVPADRPRLWDEGRAWDYVRHHATFSARQLIPSRQP
jgi:transglutaminase-like putative cysteine protease